MKKAKKLKLAKETLRDLKALTLGKVAGGDSLTDCNACTYENSCHIYCWDECITYRNC